MKKVLIMNDYIVAGGVEKVLQDLVLHLDCKKYDITVLTQYKDNNFFKVFNDSVKYKYIYNKTNENRNIIVRIYKRIINKIKMIFSLVYHNLNNYDIAIAFKEGDCMKYISKVKASKRIAWIHDDYNYIYWTKYVFGNAENELKCMRHFDSIVCVSDAVKKSVVKVVGNPGNLCVKYNPIDYLSIIEKSKKSINFRRENDKIIFIAVGRFVSYKNFILLSQICAELSSKYKFELWLIGDGVEREQIEKIISATGTNSIKILGWQENPYKYIVNANLLISTSICESYGLAIQEALILGVPVLATRCPAIDEVFDKRFGMLIKCKKNEIKKSLISLLDNPERIKKYQENIKNSYNKEELWEERFQKIEELF